MTEPLATPGARLKAERERRGLSAQKAADEMHLDAWVIDALEAGDYARIGAPVYAKGHMRKYAAMLGLPASELLSDFDSKSNPAVSASPIPLGSAVDAPANHIVSPAQMFGAAAFLALLAGVLWWKPWQQRDVTVAAAKRASAVSQAQSDTSAQMPDAMAARGSEPSRTARAIPTLAHSAEDNHAAGAPGGPAPPAGAADNVPGAGHARLRLSFTADSWVDVRDAEGNKAFVGNGSANTVKTIAGIAPMRVYLRSGSGVQLEINGRVVAIGPQFFAGDVARFEAGADGVLRREPHRDAGRGDSAAGPSPAGTSPAGTRPPG